MNDTICAISTSQGIGAIAIVRVSGSEAIEIVNSIFKGKDLDEVDTHTINYGHIVDEKGNIIDEVLVTVMKAPKTFTAEDTVEIDTHGGIAPTNKVLEYSIKHDGNEWFNYPNINEMRIEPGKEVEYQITFKSKFSNKSRCI